MSGSDQLSRITAGSNGLSRDFDVRLGMPWVDRTPHFFSTGTTPTITVHDTARKELPDRGQSTQIHRPLTTNSRKHTRLKLLSNIRTCSFTRSVAAVDSLDSQLCNMTRTLADRVMSQHAMLFHNAK